MEPTLPALMARFEAEALEALCEYVSIECLSPDFDANWREHGAIEEAIGLFAGWAATRSIDGLSVSTSRAGDATPALVVDIPATSPTSTETVLIYGHLDKQPPLGDWSPGLDPFTPVRRGDLLFGRGTADDGYALFAALLALEELAAAGRALPHCVVLVEASEESGSPDLTVHLDALAEQLGSVELVICLDSGALDFDRLWVTSSLRGNVVANVSVEVLAHGVHSGEAGGVVPSSFRLLRQLLDRIEDPLTGQVLLPELDAQPPDHLLAAAAQVANELGDPLGSAFPTVPGLELMGRDGTDRLLRQSWSPALAVTGLEGAPSLADAGNVLRASTSARLSLRIPPNVDAVLATESLVAALAADPPAGARVTVEAGHPAQGWVAPQPERWLVDAIDHASRAVFSRAPGTMGEGGSIPFLAELGQRFPSSQFLVTGVLGPGSNAHGPDESLHLPTVAGVMAAVSSVVEAFVGR
jgi:acetylornithine deacetylase/succinyl-diaminopimelate desuccinylase-like protein